MVVCLQISACDEPVRVTTSLHEDAEIGSPCNPLQGKQWKWMDTDLLCIIDIFLMVLTTAALIMKLSDTCRDKSVLHWTLFECLYYIWDRDLAQVTW